VQEYGLFSHAQGVFCVAGVIEGETDHRTRQSPGVGRRGDDLFSILNDVSECLRLSFDAGIRELEAAMLGAYKATREPSAGN